MNLLYKGPTNGLYTHGRWYRVTQDTPHGWFIVDDMGVVTNVSKRNNMLWHYQEVDNDTGKTYANE